MTREKFAEKIHWKTIIWLFGLGNVVAMLPQTYQIITTWHVEGLSLGMFITYFVIQVAFSLEGFFSRNKMFMWCLGISSLISAITIGLILFIRFYTG